MKLVFDLEADNLLHDATKIHCGTTCELEGGEINHYGPDEIEDLVSILLEADILIGHNIAGYDIPLMEKLILSRFGAFDLDKVRDTYVMSKLFYPNRAHYSLGSWGNKFGILKPEHDDWSTYSEDMEHRNVEDVKINTKLYEHLLEKNCKGWPQWVMSIRLEAHMHYWQAMQEEYGVGFDKESALALRDHLDEEIAKIDKKLDPILPMYCKQVGVSVEKPFKKDGDYAKRVIDWFEKVE